MRIWVTALLLASAAGAVPALAQDGPPPRDRGWQGGQGPQGQPPQAQPNQPQPPQAQQPQRGPRGDRGPGGGWRGGDRGPGGQPGQDGFQGRRDDPRFDRGQGGRPDAPGIRPDGDRGPGGRPGGPDGNYHHTPGYGGPGGPRPGFQGRPDDRGGSWHGDNRDRGGDRGPGGRDWRGGGGGRDGGGWDRGWRQDRRYDWRGWRDGHRSQFRGRPYRAPYGNRYGYRSYGIGTVIAPAYFGRDYWIGDPGAYRLPPADGPYRWVRYYNDALLVDIYSGQVVDAIQGFFY